MLFQKRILAIAAVLAIGALPTFAAQGTSSSASKAAAPAPKPADKPKTSAPKDHVAQGSVVTATDDMLTVRSGKKDMIFKLSSTTAKPTSMTPGSNVKVNYHDEGNQHIASKIELAPTPSKATAAKPPASK